MSISCGGGARFLEGHLGDPAGIGAIEAEDREVAQTSSDAKVNESQPKPGWSTPKAIKRVVAALSLARSCLPLTFIYPIVAHKGVLCQLSSTYFTH